MTTLTQLCSHKTKRARQIKKLMQRGLLDPEKEDPFTLFVASTEIRYCYYGDSQKILGNTYGMCVLQVQIWTPSPRCPPQPEVKRCEHSNLFGMEAP